MSRHDNDGTKFSIPADDRHLFLADSLQNNSAEEIVARPRVGDTTGSLSLKLEITQQASQKITLYPI